MKEQRILLLGANGFVGKTLQQALPVDKTLCLTSQDCDLRDISSTRFFFRAFKPTIVINVAGRVGGIIDNDARQYDYYLDNLRINTNVIDFCVKQKAYLIAFSSNCVYGTFAPSNYPLCEEQVMLNEPDPTNRAYAYAKRMILIQLQAAQRQFGYKTWTLLYPSNLYGPADTFDLQRSHVVASLIMKFQTAKDNNEEYVLLYGTGKERRQHFFVRDINNIIMQLVDRESVFGDYNCVHPDSLTIAETAQMIAEEIGYEGQIIYNNKLSGHMNKDVSNRKLKNSGIECSFTSFKDGIKQTVEWYRRFKCVIEQ